MAALAALGAWLGSLMGLGWGSTGLTAFFNAAVSLVLAILIIAGLIVTAVLVGWKRHDRRAAMLPFATAGALFVGAVGVGWGLSQLFRSPLPVVLEGRGTMSLETSGLDAYVARAQSIVICRSEVDAPTLALVEANDLGSIGVSFVGASVSMVPGDSSRQAEVRIWVQPIVKGVADPPSWLGTGDIVDGLAGDAVGRIVFAEIPLLAGETGLQPLGWPTGLSGAIDWSCGPMTTAGTQSTGHGGPTARAVER